MKRFVLRIIRVLLLDSSLYAEVKLDKKALAEAILINIAYGVLIGMELSVKLSLPLAIFFGAVSALIGWYIWAYLIFAVGAKLLPGPDKQVKFIYVLRSIGFINAIGLLRLLGFIPSLKMHVLRFSAVWMIAATVIAVRQVFNYSSTWRAISVYLVIFCIQVIFLKFIILFTGSAPGFENFSNIF